VTASYEDYLRSDHWRHVREAALARAMGRCQNSGCHYRLLSREELAAYPPRGYTLDVHHMTYDRLGHERLDDVLVLCRRCHGAAHGLEFSEEPSPFSEVVAGVVRKLEVEA